MRHRRHKAVGNFVIALGVDVEHLPLEHMGSQVGQAEQKFGLTRAGAADDHRVPVE